MSRLDLVVFGATGFTGKHAVQELVPIAKQRGLTWAVAGRSLDKLTSLLKEASTKTGEDLSAIKTILADVENERSLRDMCEQAKVVISCCGPYTLYGEPVVQAAIASGTHYVDCSGEPHFIEGMQLKYQQKARDAGVYVVSACGFESIPVDLGVLFLQDKFDGILHSVESYMNAKAQSGSINRGTWESFVLSVPHLMELPALRKQIYPSPLPKFKPKLKYKLFHKRFNGWCLPFPANDSSAVYRTQRFLYETEQKRPAQIKTYVKFHSLLHTLVLAVASVFIMVMGYFKFTRSLLLKHSSTFSAGMIANGPSEELVKEIEYEYELYGVGWERSEETHIETLPPRKTMVARIYGKNPGYGMTVMGLIFSAVAILKEQFKMPAGGGVLAPGQAFGKTSLVRHLQEHGVHFEIVTKDKGA